LTRRLVGCCPERGADRFIGEAGVRRKELGDPAKNPSIGFCVACGRLRGRLISISLDLSSIAFMLRCVNPSAVLFLTGYAYVFLTKCDIVSTNGPTKPKPTANTADGPTVGSTTLAAFWKYISYP
jgi:hypothetical protein